ncbi:MULTISPECIES: TraR/DksA family transcriptional regulator [Marinobacter]|jgi:RNA polymerase-binding transcription factor DksA|uniref:TraR/DksA family transcriptional regulator n=1 Tax=Marinobacter TaxID=2742 RepID=UPI0003B90E89|nr:MULTISPECIES: TraR/DksA C4-type zinc finger protein [Marinobacter]MCG8524436.1 TraR/DksA C4-type zinc finger protein [Pseudomonadales bacterium]ERS12435.1 conjugal transfer protein TraR [Marinobacter sp. EN3]MBY5936282.1 TraR/DksA C4-type zinc finger protein [Marinobacter nauticus]MBY5953511.1 TraR/DksA C4-type zinc finger protein [Marinobacter nauticus]MBY6007304.1 TraR/DksA C4-type zinc finger protein [Marinobacter nauticus]|tara:strand:- start:783 stop:1103 length:321 start_codon:yes stop_codon:yes gene_type:complete
MANRKSELETLKADLEARLSRYQAHQRREAGALEKDFEEQASQTQNDEVVDSLEAETRAELQQIDHALERIDQGAGNECEQCGNDIDPRRLQVLPYTTVCVDCASD